MQKMFIPILRAPGDEYSFNLIKQLFTSDAPEDCAAYYIWTNPESVITTFLEHANFSTHRNVVIAVKDLLGFQEYNYWSQTQQNGITHLQNTISKFPETNFILITSYEHMDRELCDVPNLQIVYWGGDILNQATEYSTVPPVLDKNFNSSKHYISLNRFLRAHRLFLLSYLYGSKYDEYGQLTFLGNQNLTTGAEFLDLVCWWFSDHHNNIRATVLQGYDVLSKFESNKNQYDIYSTSGLNNNVDNFISKLTPMYQNSFVEIVTETTFASPAFMLTEKTLNSVYGCNFSILLSGYGAVKHLRDIGFDVFDDVIDHSYDLISDPIDRLVAAIELNRQLLVDATFAKEQWKRCRPRFEQNVEVARTMYQWFDTRTTNMFRNLVWK